MIGHASAKPRIWRTRPSDSARRPISAFSARAIASYTKSDDETPARIDVSFLGLWGANGPMPLHLTEYAYQRARHSQDHTLTAFANIFHHRILTLLYRAWANAQPTTSNDRPEADRFAAFIAALTGIDRSTEDGGPSGLDHLSMYVASHFVGTTRHPEGLAKALSVLLDVPVSIEEFVGEWLDVPSEFCWQLAAKNVADTRLGQLGLGTRLGRQKWERQFKFRVVLGPMRRATYERLLPGGADLARVVSVVRRYTGADLSWDLRLILRTSDMQPTRLGVAGRLGTSTYLVRAQNDGTRHWQDLTFNPLHVPSPSGSSAVAQSEANHV
ncbi:MAG: type VI secretion system baseplate subunit TssG [Myxococcales bacterium]